MLDRIADPWGVRTPYGRDEPWPTRVDVLLDPGLAEGDVERWVHSACVLCANGCALDIAVKDGRMVGVRGRGADHPNHGRLGPKGLFGWQANRARDRLTRPLVRRGERLVEADWDTAMDAIAARSREIRAKHGAGAFGFYNSGQLLLEEYYTLSLLARGGLGTPHVDGNTRLCTATAAQSMRESFGCDGQPSSMSDVDHCDTLFLVGYNVAETQTVFWMRMLDRLDGPDPPRLVVVDPRRSVPARRADVHLPIKSGTNVALLNAILHEILRNGWLDRAFVDAHTIGLDALAALVDRYPPARAASICGVPADRIREAARVLGSAERLFSACLQGVYQSNQATAAAVQVNNIHLVRGMIGRPGCGIIQSNGQPTSQNTRETGCNGEMPGFRNHRNRRHMEELARIWNVDPLVIPSWGAPTHAMKILRYAAEGSIKLLWIIATNPAVSIPELRRLRSTLDQEPLFVVVQDAFLTETARHADIVLPAAIWGEKTGTFTNTDRTVHLTEKAVEPPGEARSDLDILLDYARRMDLRDKDGAPLVKWRTPEEAFEAWKLCSKGRPCDYTGITYDRLRSGGIQWPCTDERPEGTPRLYTDHRFFSDPEVAQDFGHDLDTGGARSETEFRALNPAGRAFLRASEYLPPIEEADDDYPFLLTTGRTIYQFHTRTKTARAPQLQRAAPDAWVEIAAPDASRLAIEEGDWVRVESPRGHVVVRARISEIREGAVFLPFHYGTWDEDPESHRWPRTANELTISAWDPVSKQPYFKVAKVKLLRVAASGGVPSPAPTTGAAAPAPGVVVPPTVGGPAAEESNPRPGG
ncbi:molybdopterin oxidoreductase family protein [Sorangium sp. So ce381]|uniref:molybdopterin oxidoreductase family protein n=1 Tax=Sorangium sp. So ce381 TaxID=3133307 RepID=UPI003F5C1A84